jgi:molybdopterin-containing oxidoreductase family iron-sulfur binding subunit
MKLSRRDFLKTVGVYGALGAVGIAGGTFILKKGLDAAEIEDIKAPEGALTAKRWGMVIDVTKLDEESCKRITEACHSIHNVPDIGTNQDIKWIWTEEFENAFPGVSDDYLAERLKHTPFLVLCNHCQNPACVRVCPTQATYKRPDGIVAMDYHRCIGCRFCMAACPYGSRSFNFMDPRPHLKRQNADFPTRMKGVVEKCTFCTERLAKGLKPACAEVSGGAIVVGDLEDPGSEVRQILAERFSLRRKPELGTGPSVYYVI